MRNRLRGAVPVWAVFLLGLAVWPAVEALKSGESGVTVHDDPATPEERAEFREALRYREETGKWPCPGSGRPPQQGQKQVEEGVSDLVYRAGPDDYDCPTQDGQR